MSEDKDCEVLSLLQPELLTPDQLINSIKSRCSKVQNLTAMPKDRLVRLFRQMILPLPQRRYRGNRRGRLLTARRMKSGLERGEEEKGSRNGKKADDDRLKPTPDSSTPNKIRLAASEKRKRSDDLDKIVINDRRRCSENDRKSEETSKYGTDSDPSSSRRIVLKRSTSNAEKCDGEPNKKAKTAIKWP